MVMTEAVSGKEKALIKAREDIIEKIFMSEYEDKLVLVSEADSRLFLDSGNWDKIRNSHLDIDCVEDVADDLRLLLENMAETAHSEEIEKNTYVSMNFTIDRYHIPIVAEIKKVQEIKEEFIAETFLSLEDDHAIKYNRYRIEEKLAGSIMNILENLEFIRDMDSYDQMISVLEKTSVDGRRIKKALEESFGEHDVAEIRERIKIVEGYENYPFMKKRWKTHIKKTGKNEPEWNNLIKTLGVFLNPIVDAIEKDIIFFSDWMPELGRYLD